MTQPLSDEDLLTAYAAGDARAARDLIQRLAPRLLALARRMLADPVEAEDIVQESLLRLWQIAPRWEPGAATPATWVYRVALNLATDRLRRRAGGRRGLALDEVDEPPDQSPAVLDRIIAADRMQALDLALARLPDRQRAAVVLRHIEGMSNPEIAAQLDIGVEAVESLTARGKRRLADLLSAQREELGFDP